MFCEFSEHSAETCFILCATVASTWCVEIGKVKVTVHVDQCILYLLTVLQMLNGVSVLHELFFYVATVSPLAAILW